MASSIQNVKEISARMFERNSQSKSQLISLRYIDAKALNTFRGHVSSLDISDLTYCENLVSIACSSKPLVSCEWNTAGRASMINASLIK